MVVGYMELLDAYLSHVYVYAHICTQMYIYKTLHCNWMRFICSIVAPRELKKNHSSYTSAVCLHTESSYGFQGVFTVPSRKKKKAYLFRPALQYAEDGET